ncbi:MAG: hypothetical protein J5992_06190, partial [Oscillospiraceae bacterium]|nr:hypothetical protein [Oscillospiraceae bacterium]
DESSVVEETDEDITTVGTDLPAIATIISTDTPEGEEGESEEDTEGSTLEPPKTTASETPAATTEAAATTEKTTTTVDAATTTAAATATTITTVTTATTTTTTTTAKEKPALSHSNSQLPSVNDSLGASGNDSSNVNKKH